MTDYNFGDLLKTAKAEGYASSLLPDGPAQLQVRKVKISQTQGQPPKTKVGVMVVLTSGPNAGNTTWLNQTLSPENATALQMFFKFFEQFGVDEAFWQQTTSDNLEIMLKSRLEQLIFQADVGHRSWTGKNAKPGTEPNVDNTFANVQILGQGPLQTPAPQPQAQPVVVAPAPAPVAAPVAAAPAAVAVQPVPQPVVQQIIPQPAPVALPQVVAAPLAQAVVPGPVAQPVADPVTGIPAAPAAPSF